MNKVINILLLEDDLLDQIQVQRALDHKGVLHKIIILRNGEEGIRFLSNNPENELGGYPDIILLDLNMPKMNGIEFLTEFRKHEEWNDIKIFVLTTSEQERHRTRLFNVSGYILKPLKLNSPSMDTIALMIDMMNLQAKP